MSKTYAGIGSRRTPADVLALMTTLAERLAADGWWLRSGHAPGADQAFEAGAGNAADAFLPWPDFEQHVPIEGMIYGAAALGAFGIASNHHPAWHICPPSVRCLHARNVHQVLGWRLDTPSRFVVCWTPDGSLDGGGPNTGGTGQALRIAKAYDVPVFNLQRPDHRARVAVWVDTGLSLVA